MYFQLNKNDIIAFEKTRAHILLAYKANFTSSNAFTKLKFSIPSFWYKRRIP